GSEGLACPVTMNTRELLDARFGLDRHVSNDLRIAGQDQRAQPADAVAGHFCPAAVGVEQPHRHTAAFVAVDGQADGAGAHVATAHFPRQKLEAGAFDVGRPDVEKVVSVGVSLGESHLRQKASRCQPKRWTMDRGSTLKVPTKTPLYTAPFQPPWRRDFT